MAIIRDLPMAEYLQSPRLSTGKLRDFESRGPRFFYMRHVARTLAYDDSTQAKDFGQGFEDLLCRPNDFAQRYAIKPEGMTFATKEGKAWRAEREAEGKGILTEQEHGCMRAMVDAIHEHQLAASLFRGAAEQVTFTVDATGLPGLQSRPDWCVLEGLPFSGYRPVVFDLKSILSLSMVERSTQKYGYHAQGAIARHCLAANGHLGAVVMLCFVEKATPHRVRVVELSDAYLDAGWRWCTRVMGEVRECFERNEWPRCDESVLVLDPPAWLLDDDEDEAA